MASRLTSIQRADLLTRCLRLLQQHADSEGYGTTPLTRILEGNTAPLSATRVARMLTKLSLAESHRVAGYRVTTTVHEVTATSLIMLDSVKAEQLTGVEVTAISAQVVAIIRRLERQIVRMEQELRARDETIARLQAENRALQALLRQGEAGVVTADLARIIVRYANDQD